MHPKNLMALLVAFPALLEAQVLYKHVVVRNLQKKEHWQISGCWKTGPTPVLFTISGTLGVSQKKWYTNEYIDIFVRRKWIRTVESPDVSEVFELISAQSVLLQNFLEVGTTSICEVPALSWSVGM